MLDTPEAGDELRTVEVLGVPISVIDIDSALDTIAGWITQGKPRFITAVDVHGVMTAQGSPTHLADLRGADMVAPDGQPLVWVGRARGCRGMRRVAGPDLLQRLCARSNAEGWRHYFYGGATGVADELVSRLRRDNSRLNVVGIECPPFRPLTHAEKRNAASRINASGADIVWVGLGCPKQERWIGDVLPHIDRAILIAVGAAFDFHSGNIKRAPRWMQRSGLEWLHRLYSEPRRLWRRYLILAPSFILMVARETVVNARRRPSA